MASSSILVLTTSRAQAIGFVTRLLAHSNLPAPPTTDANESIEYQIDNKYYSAVVPIVIKELDEVDGGIEQGGGGDFPVLIWLLPEGEEPTSRSIPSALQTHLSSSSPPDVALAILTPSSSSSTTSADLPESFLDAYDDLGMELIDEGALAKEEPDEEDEDYSPPLPPLEQISQAIQTHLWPNLILKTQPSSSKQPKRAPSSTSPAAAGSAAVSFPQSFSSSLDDPLPTQPTHLQSQIQLSSNAEEDDFGPLQNASTSTSSMDFTSEDFAAALAPPTSSEAHLNTQTQKKAAERSFTDSFAPSASSPSSSQPQPQTQFPSSFVPPPPNGELLLDSDSTALFAGLDMSMAGFERLVDSDDDEDAPGLNDVDLDLTSTLMSLRGLREELGRVEDEEERRELAGRLVEGLFGMGGMGLGDEDAEEGMGGRI
ncbi:hypothetical protein BDY24DRAFT_375046 [Mrakia frigida]|uniref:uncharacterized protein n=1 Tax=Mrakia frigida TaxID=29902 RepID=UPI003FCC203C